MLSLLLACVPHLACTLRPPPPGPSPAEARAQAPEVVHLDGASPFVQAMALLHAGSATDPTGAEGLAWRSARALLFEPGLRVEGLSLDVQVGREWVRLEARGPAERGAEVVALLAAALAPAPPSPEALEAAAADAERALAALESDAGILAAEVGTLALFDAHPYGHPVPGRRGVAGLIDEAAVAAHRRRTWVREAARVGVAGPLAPGALQPLREAVEGLATAAAPRPLPARHPRLDGLVLYLVEADLPTAAASWAIPLDVRAGALDLAPLVAATAVFALDGARLHLAEGEPRTQPSLHLDLPALPPEAVAGALDEALGALEAWRQAEPPAPGDVGRPQLPEALYPTASAGLDPFSALPPPGQGVLVVVTGSPQTFIDALVEDGRLPSVHDDGAASASDWTVTRLIRIPIEGLLR